MGLDTRKPVFRVSKQQKRRPACASAQPDQHLCYSLIEMYHILSCYKRIFKPVSVAEQAGLDMAYWKTLKADFLLTRPLCNSKI